MNASSGQDQAKWAFLAGVSISTGIAIWLWRRQASRGSDARYPSPKEVMRWEGEGGSLPPDEDTRADFLPAVAADSTNSK